MKIILNSFIVLILFFSISCDNDNRIDLVRNFLNEQDVAKKMEYFKFDSDKIDSADVVKNLERLPSNYIEIQCSKDSIDDVESIIDVILKKYRLGLRIINQKKEIFLIKENGQYKIDYTATFNPRPIDLDSLFNMQLDSVVKLRVLLVPDLESDSILSQNPLKSLHSVYDNITGETLNILDDSLAVIVGKLIKSNQAKHLIVTIRRHFDNQSSNYILESIMQNGWAKKVK